MSHSTALRTASIVLGRRRHRGISLLEVLISMGVMLVGTLSVFALLTLGQFEMLEATKADRSQSIARAAEHSIKSLGMLRPVVYDVTNGSGTVPYVTITWRGANNGAQFSPPVLPQGVTYWPSSLTPRPSIIRASAAASRRSASGWRSTRWARPWQ